MPPNLGSHARISSDTKAIDGPGDVSEHLFNRLLAVNLNEDAALGIETEKRLRLGIEDLKTMGDPHLGIVVPSFLLPPRTEALAQLIDTRSQIDHGLERDLLLVLSQGIRFFGLVQCPRETVEHIAAVASCLQDASRHHFEHQLIGDEIPRSKYSAAMRPILVACITSVRKRAPLDRCVIL